MHPTWIRAMMLAALALVACDGLYGTRSLVNTQFDDWCDGVPCGWDLKAGSVRKVETWHERDYGVELVGAESEISQRAGRPSSGCVRIEVVTRSDPSATLKLALDFDGDGLTDFEQALPSSRWKRHIIEVGPPVGYIVMRYVLRKSGEGSAAVASIGVGHANQSCYTRSRLRSGSFCVSDDSCELEHRCVDGRCADCRFGACAAGAACEQSNECATGACAGGLCAECAASASCAARAPCSASAQCESGECSFGALPSLITRPSQEGVCGECRADRDCPLGVCVLGFCSECRTSSDCAGGLACRYRDVYDASERACLPQPDVKRTRGQLCESTDECEAGLECGAAPSRAKRCGISCATNADCGDGVCAALGVRALAQSAELASTPAFESDPAARVRTCHPRLGPDLRCVVDVQCPAWLAACCEGICENAVIDRTNGTCTDHAALL